jgi:hypothetical protein
MSKLWHMVPVKRRSFDDQPGFAPSVALVAEGHIS